MSRCRRTGPVLCKVADFAKILYQEHKPGLLYSTINVIWGFFCKEASTGGVYIPFSHSRCMNQSSFHPARVLSSLDREIEARLFEVQAEHAQNFLRSLCSLRVHLTIKLLDGFTTLLMLSVHVWSCCTCPLCTIDPALEKLVTKA